MRLLWRTGKSVAAVDLLQNAAFRQLVANGLGLALQVHTHLGVLQISELVKPLLLHHPLIIGISAKQTRPISSQAAS